MTILNKQVENAALAAETIGKVVDVVSRHDNEIFLALESCSKQDKLILLLTRRVIELEKIIVEKPKNDDLSALEHRIDDLEKRVF